MLFTTETIIQSAPGRSWFTGNQLKYFAAVLMVFDHTHKFLLPNVEWLTMLGRLVIPVFVFMVAEGMYYTRSRKRYILQLLIGFEAMSVGNMIINHLLVFRPIDWESIPDGVSIAATSVTNNIFGTMLMIALLITMIDWAIAGFKERRVKQAVLGSLALAALVGISYGVFELGLQVMDLMMEGTVPESAYNMVALIPSLLTTEGGVEIVLLGAAYYLLRRWRWAQMLALAAVSVYFFVKINGVQWMMGFAILPLIFYNGKRGKGVNPKFDKWFFYIFYPAHIYLLFVIAWLLQR